MEKEQKKWIPELMQFDKSAIVQKKWPKLVEWLRTQHGAVYTISTIPDKKAEYGTITLLTRAMDGWEIRSFERGPGGHETVAKIRISDKFTLGMAFTIMPETVGLVPRREKIGRPAKYNKYTAIDIHHMRQKGMTIRAIATHFRMSTATVQRLLNQIESPAQRKAITERNRRKKKEAADARKANDAKAEKELPEY